MVSEVLKYCDTIETQIRRRQDAAGSSGASLALTVTTSRDKSDRDVILMRRAADVQTSSFRFPSRCGKDNEMTGDADAAGASRQSDERVQGSGAGGGARGAISRI